MKQINANIPYNTLEAKNHHRDQIELLRNRLNLLHDQDKVLMTMYLENGNSFRQIARLLRVDETHISRKIHRLTKRLTKGEYINCVRNRDKLTRFQKIVAKEFYLTGLSVRRIASKRNTSRYHIRETLKKIQSIIEDSK